ncbi:MAG: DUF4271 domain-containing protein [Bacteroidales bacterium]|nr:DUF4271 domain-containing protein [Bacteroidales bacterium]
MFFGRLHLPTSPAGVPAELWSDLTVNRILVIVAAVLALLSVLDYFQLCPLLIGCMLRERGNVEIEHSVSQARNRNRCAIVALFILCILADRYGLYPASFIDSVPAPFRVAAILGVLLAFLLLRVFLYFMIDTVARPKLDSESRLAAHRAIFNYFLAVMPLVLVTVLVLWIFKATDNVIRMAIWVELAVFMFITLLREGQIFLSRHTGFQTFLYLCGLELLPVAAVVVSAVLL